MPTPRHGSEVFRVLQAPPAAGTSEVSIGSLTDRRLWLSGIIERSEGDLANTYEVSLGDGSSVTASSVLDGVPLQAGDPVWLVPTSGRHLIAGVR